MSRKFCQFKSLFTLRMLTLSALIVVVSLLQTAYGDFVIRQGGCPTDRDEFVTVMLPSITNPVIFKASSIGAEPTNPLAQAWTGSGIIALPLPLEEGEGEPTSVLVNLEPNELIVGSERAFPFNTYSGSAEGFEDSRASFFVRTRFEAELTPASLVGFILLDPLPSETSVSVGGADFGEPGEARWYFYEPIRPLLDGILAAERPENSCSEADLERFFPQIEELADTSIIVYATKDTDFLIDLDPYGVESGEGEGALTLLEGLPTDRNQSQLNSSQGQSGCQPQPCEVNLLIVADPEYLKLKGGQRQAEDDFTALVNMLYTSGNLNFYSLFGVRLKLNFIGVEVWETSDQRIDGTAGRAPGADFKDAPNAYQLLCDFTQNVDHGHGDGQKPTIVHLFTGWDLAKFPEGDHKRISDSGDDFCPMGCGGDGEAIVGLAEGIGGLRSASGKSCGASPYLEMTAFNPASHHSLSQHKPKSETSSTTRNFDGNIFQRWVLMAHELGHNIGANHTTFSASVMYDNIGKELNYYLAQPNQTEINDCLEGIAAECR